MPGKCQEMRGNCWENFENNKSWKRVDLRRQRQRWRKFLKGYEIKEQLNLIGFPTKKFACCWLDRDFNLERYTNLEKIRSPNDFKWNWKFPREWITIQLPEDGKEVREQLVLTTFIIMCSKYNNYVISN